MASRGGGWGGVGATVGGVGVGRWVALVVGAGGLCPEDRFARGGVGLGVVVGKPLSLPTCVRGIEGRARPCAAGLIEFVSRVHDGGAAAERLVIDFWIREVRGAGAWVDRMGGAGAWVDRKGGAGVASTMTVTG